MLKKGDTIRCFDMQELGRYCNALKKEGYKVDVNLRKLLLIIRRTPEELKDE